MKLAEINSMMNKLRFECEEWHLFECNIKLQPGFFFLNISSDLMRTTKSNTKVMPPPLCDLSMGPLLSPYLACRKQFYFPLLLVSVQWGCLLQPGLHPWVVYLCQHSAGGEKHPFSNRLVIMAHGWPTVWEEAFQLLAAKTDWQLFQERILHSCQ